MVADSEIQRIARLTPLADVLASFDLSVGPVEPREEAVSKALGLTLAGVSPYWQNFAIGTLIIVAVGLDQWIRKVAK